MKKGPNIAGKASELTAMAAPGSHCLTAMRGMVSAYFGDAANKGEIAQTIAETINFYGGKATAAQVTRKLDN